MRKWMLATVATLTVCAVQAVSINWNTGTLLGANEGPKNGHTYQVLGNNSLTWDESKSIQVSFSISNLSAASGILLAYGGIASTTAVTWSANAGVRLTLDGANLSVAIKANGKGNLLSPTNSETFSLLLRQSNSVISRQGIINNFLGNEYM